MTFSDLYAEFSSGVLDNNFALPEKYNTASTRISVGKSPRKEELISDALKILGSYVEFEGMQYFS